MIKHGNVYWEASMIEGKGLFFKMSSFGLHYSLETFQGGATLGTDLFLGDGVPL